MAGTIPWGPASITANTPTNTPALTLQPGDNSVTATADFAALAAGVTWHVLTQYRKSTGDPWVDFGAAGGVTLGGPDHDKQGNVTETGIHSGPFPDPGISGRQIRAVVTLGVSATLSGHVTTAA